MKRKTKKPGQRKKPVLKAATLKIQVGAMRVKVEDLTAEVRSRLDKLAVMVEQTNHAVSGLRDTPLAAVREIDKVLGKLEGLGLDKAEKIDAIFPNLPAQFNAMAEAVNKISAYAKALEESEVGFRLRKETRDRYAEETDEELLAKLRHRLGRMEQKL